MPRIRPLDKSVVNRIAAGEIIIAPSNALKEMLENSIDAKSDAVDVSVKDGGLKLLQITDNGSGISKEDLPLLCERFATSKLTKFEDLQSISTYGFRGEALASISHISHLSVVTKTAKEPCAYRCYYLDGKLVPPPGNSSGSSEPAPTAGRDGTSVVVEDLFYNVPSRLRSLKSHSEEYAKILDVVSKYAIHTEGVGFTCKKQGTSAHDLTIRSSMSCKDRIRAIYGSSVANELVPVSTEADLDIGLIKCSGYITGPNYDNKKTHQPVFFINNRLVACYPLRRAINQVYSAYLPKGRKPFFYLALEIDPKNVDVNVHPTKRDVRFLNEEEIIEKVTSAIEAELSSQDSSRTFLTQQVITESQRKRQRERERERPAEQQMDLLGSKADESSPRKLRSVLSIKQFTRKPYEKDMVRTDFAQGTLNSFVRHGTVVDDTVEEPKTAADDDDHHDDHDHDGTPPPPVLTSSEQPQPNVVNLSSIKNLRKEVQGNTSPELTNVFSKHTYVGVADYERRLVCIQQDVRLYLVDFASVCNEFFYQVGLSDFSNFGKIRFKESVDIRKLLLQEIYDNEELIAEYPNAPSLDDLMQSVFVDMAEMLNEYFSLEITDDGKLETVPMLVRSYVPPFNKLALFLFKLGARVNWDDEQECLGGILRQLALFYIPEPVDSDDEEEKEKLAKTLEDVLFPLIKKRFLATENLRRDVVEIANLPGLYKVFERC